MCQDVVHILFWKHTSHIYACAAAPFNQGQRGMTCKFMNTGSSGQLTDTTRKRVLTNNAADKRQGQVRGIFGMSGAGLAARLGPL